MSGNRRDVASTSTSHLAVDERQVHDEMSLRSTGYARR
jgi:hypothetical protein